MTIQTQITLDLVNRQAPLVVHAKQYDNNTRQIAALLTENGAAFDIPDGTTAIFQMAKPDGTYVFYDSDEAGDPAVVIDGSIVTVTLVAAALQVAGECQAQIDLYNAGDKLTSFTFIIAVQPSTVPDDAISETYVNVLTELIGEAQAAAQQAEAAISTTAANAAAAAASASAAAASATEAAASVTQIESELSNYVPTSRMVNNKALSANITLDAADVGARDATWMPTAADVGAVSNSISTASITFTNATNASNTILQKQGRLVVGQLVGRVNASVAAASFLNNWMNLPADFAPSKLTIFPIAFGAEDLRVYVNADGAVNLYNGTSAALSTTKTMNFVVTYMA